MFKKVISTPCLAAVLFLCLVGCDKKTEHSNRLARSSSPYLREHSDNPVDWYEWGTEALEKAKKEDKPLIISIGYASCHWCHVMEDETFMDTAVAKFMNDNFVSIKVDREERPDIDQIYLNAAQLTSGSSGWPLNAFALPNGKPFYGATYFTKDQWMQMLAQILEVRKNDRQNLERQARELTLNIWMFDEKTRAQNSNGDLGNVSYQAVFSNWESSFDFKSGGISGAPKFPLPVIGEYLLQNYYLTGNRKALELVTTTLDEMGKGGIYDQLGGGFSRYATDEKWRVPHFEKMLYDNGQLVSLYAHAFQATGNPRYEELIHETLDFIKLEMTSPEGGFYSSLNADSEGEEGKFYVWTTKKIRELVNPDASELFIEYYNLSDTGNWEKGNNILYRTQSREEFAQKHSMTPGRWEELLRAARAAVLMERNKRIHPDLDYKILTSWNALMLNGYVDGYLATGHQPYLDAALKNASFLEKKMVRDKGRLWRNYVDGKGSIDAFLDDYAILAQAYIHLYEATFDLHWLSQARSITDYAVNHFRDEQSGLFYYSADESEFVVARRMELTDQVMPSSNSILGKDLFLLAEYFDNNSYREMSRSLLSKVSGNLSGKRPSYASWANLLGLMTYQPYEVAIVGTTAVEKSHLIQKHYLPTAIFLGGESENLPLLENKLIHGETTIYVCQNRVCKLPTKEVDQALQQLKIK